ncbi:hypothetical protein JTB14_004615 [Gonioctena quinquepunctata]|nr:hypothetical protein JTB14_004615 [Gonioctena quinquepunctata]
MFFKDGPRELFQRAIWEVVMTWVSRISVDITIGKWSLLYESSRTLQERRVAILDDASDKSITLKSLDLALKYVIAPEFNRIELSLSSSCSRMDPRMSRRSEPQRELCAFILPISKNGIGSCDMRSSNSSFRQLASGRYRLHIFMVIGARIQTATACKTVFSTSGEWGIFFLIGESYTTLCTNHMIDIFSKYVVTS